MAGNAKVKHTVAESTRFGLANRSGRHPVTSETLSQRVGSSADHDGQICSDSNGFTMTWHSRVTWRRGVVDDAQSASESHGQKGTHRLLSSQVRR